MEDIGMVKISGVATALTLTLLLGGCGGDSGSTSFSGSGGGNPNPSPSPSGVNLNFTVANFGGAMQATLLKRTTPSSEQGSSLAVTSTVAHRHDSSEERDLPPEILQRERARLRQISPRADLGPVRPRFQQLAKGALQDFFVVTTGQTVTCQKMLAENQTTHCTIFAQVVGGNPVLSEARALEIQEAFDTNNPFLPGEGIYDQVRSIFGSEWTSGGGRDGDAKINLVLLNSNGIGRSSLFGFFRPGDEYARAQVSDSNEGEILYLNIDKAVGDNFDFHATVAHEFQHLITFNLKEGRQGQFNGTEENSAIDEGKSVLCEDLLGFGWLASGGGNSFLFNTCNGFLSQPSAGGLFQFNTTPGDYGRGYTMMRYLLDRYGMNSFRSYTQASGSGLAQLRTSFADFPAVFADWHMALLASPLAGPVPSQWKFSSAFNPRGTYQIRGLGNRTLPGFTPSQTVSPPAGNQVANLAPWTVQSVLYRNGRGTNLSVNLTGANGAGGSLLLESPAGTFSGAR